MQPDSPWRPLSVRHNDEAIAEYDLLHEGLPAWMVGPAANWVGRALYGYRDKHSTDGALMLLQFIEGRLRLPLDWRNSYVTAEQSLMTEVVRGGPRSLDVVDAVVQFAAEPIAAELLEVILAGGNSAWRVDTVDGHSSLVRRVDETLQRVVHEELSAPGNPARHLRIAWMRVYGRTTDASSGYREAVRAVEAAAKPLIEPLNPRATLGTMIKAVEAKPSKWAADVGSVEAVGAMMAQLWTSQLDRHGTDDETVALTVSIDQARAAVALAVTLVQWMRAGYFRVC